MKIFYFTSTGNNLYIAKKLGGELYSIPKVLKGNQFEFEAEKIGIIFPCYYFGTPKIVKEFIKKANLKSQYIFTVMSYGNISAGGLDHFVKLAKSSNIKISYANEILMVDNYLPIFDMQEQVKKIPSKNIEKNLNQIISDIDKKTLFIKNNKFYSCVFSSLLQLYYPRGLKKAVSKFIIEDTCNSCRICEKVCPVNNIKVTQKPKYQHHCEECLACAHHCPQNAIKIKGEKSNARFINQNITLKEIIESNN